MASKESETGYSAPIVLSVIAGALILTGALLPLIWYYMPTGMGMMMQGRGMMGMYYGWSGQWWWQQQQLQYLGIPYTSIVGLVSGSLVILGSIMLGNKGYGYRTWAILILASSIVSLLSMGGFIIGSILGIIAGSLALSRSSKPIFNEI
ncbi:MAG: hypothetical protein QW572_08265 [Candidatus Nitrosocaldus sp.]